MTDKITPAMLKDIEMSLTKVLERYPYAGLIVYDTTLVDREALEHILHSYIMLLQQGYKRVELRGKDMETFEEATRG